MPEHELQNGAGELRRSIHLDFCEKSRLIAPQNHGRLSARKPVSQFDALTDAEVAAMEQALRAIFGSAAG